MEVVEALQHARRNDPSYHRIPDIIFGGLARYLVHGILPGHFLTAVLKNDLSDACGRADHENALIFQPLLMWLYNEAPGAGCCWGNADAPKQWLAVPADERRRVVAGMTSGVEYLEVLAREA